MSFLVPVFAAVGKAVSSIGLGTLASVGSSVVGGLTAYQQAQYQSKIAEYNQTVANQNADSAILAGRQQAMEQDTLTRGMLGEQLSAQSTSGLSTDSRSNVLTRSTARRLGRLDALNVIYGSEATARNYRTQAAGFGMERAAAKSAGTGALLNTFISTGSLLSQARGIRSPERYTGTPYGRPQGLVR